MIESNNDALNFGYKEGNYEDYFKNGLDEYDFDLTEKIIP